MKLSTLEGRASGFTMSDDDFGHLCRLKRVLTGTLVSGKRFRNQSLGG